MCVHSIWRRVWSRSRPYCVKCLEINPMYAWLLDEGTVQTRLCQMAGNQFYVCAWDVKEGTVQTWLFQMAGNQSSVCMVCGGGYSPNLTVSNGWKSSLCVYMVCEGGYRPNLIVSHGWKSSLYVCIVCYMYFVKIIKLLLLWHETCNMTPHVFNKKKCYLSIDMFIYSTFAELKLLFIHIFYSVKHLKNIYSSLLFSLLAVNYNIFNVLRTNSELILTMWNNIRSI